MPSEGVWRVLMKSLAIRNRKAAVASGLTSVLATLFAAILAISLSGCTGLSGGQDEKERLSGQETSDAGVLPEQSTGDSDGTSDAQGSNDASDEEAEPALEGNSQDREGDGENMCETVEVSIGGMTFELALEDGETARAFLSALPAEIVMEELNGNEKYAYLDRPLPTQASCPGRIEAGDVMLYGDDCLVVFYESHETTYQYTKIGELTSTEGLVEAVGADAVEVSFA